MTLSGISVAPYISLKKKYCYTDIEIKKNISDKEKNNN